MKDSFIQLIQQNIPELIIKPNETMANHTSFRVGGPADIFVEPDEEGLIQLIKLCRQEDVPFTVLGNGSNVLVSDKGIRGLCLCLAKPMSTIEVNGCDITAGAGALLSQVANQALQNSLSGMETLSGIPGSVGGAVLMNAGAYGGEVKDVLVSARVLMEDGNIKEYTNEELDLSYRHSAIMDKGGIILSAKFRLQMKDKDLIQADMKEYARRRVEKQPLEYPSAGSTFKRPEGYFAGKLIQDAGLKGYTVGGAQVSEKHSGFVINKGGASAADVVTLMNDVSSKVYDQFEVNLEPEVRKIGEF